MSDQLALLWPAYVKLFVGLFAIANPIGAIPSLLLLTGDLSADERKRLVKRCSSAVAFILVGSALAGDSILAAFGLGIPALRAGGGVLIMLMAISMLHARTSHASQAPGEIESARAKEDVSIVPLAIPVIAGPGAISLMIVTSDLMPGWVGRLTLSACALTFTLVLWIVLRMADPIAHALGKTGLNVTTRIMGLLLVAVGAQMLTTGLKELLPGLAG